MLITLLILSLDSITSVDWTVMTVVRRVSYDLSFELQLSTKVRIFSLLWKYCENVVLESQESMFVFQVLLLGI